MTRPPVLMLDKQLVAARAMLAALKQLAGMTGIETRKDAWSAAYAAIKQAEAAGITTGEDDGD